MNMLHTYNIIFYITLYYIILYLYYIYMIIGYLHMTFWGIVLIGLGVIDLSFIIKSFKIIFSLLCMAYWYWYFAFSLLHHIYVLSDCTVGLTSGRLAAPFTPFSSLDRLSSRQLKGFPFYRFYRLNTPSFPEKTMYGVN